MSNNKENVTPVMQIFIDWYNDPNGLYLPSEVHDKMDELLELEKQQLAALQPAAVEEKKQEDENGIWDESEKKALWKNPPQSNQGH